MRWSTGWRAGLYSLVLLAGVGARTPLAAQDPREEPVARAFNEFDTARRLQLLAGVLDPSLGPTTGAWPTGVQLLAQTLIEEGNDSLAGTFLRWAVRLSPGFQADTVEFLPQVGTATTAARSFVRQSATAADSLVETSWQWPAQGGMEGEGKLVVSAPSVTSSLQASVEGGGILSPDAPMPLPPGSYRVSAAAAGYDSLAVTREVLPGVTTVLLLRPARSAVAAAEPPAQPRIPPENAVIQPESRKKFPWLLVVGGVAAAGAVVALAGGGGDNGGPPPPPPTTGGITFTFPNP